MIDSISPELEKILPNIQKARDAIDGEDALKLTGKIEAYIFRPKTQSQEVYESIVHRALYYNYPARIINVLNSVLHRKKLDVKKADSVKAALKHVAKEGYDLDYYSKEIGAEILSSGRVITVIDMNAKSEIFLTPYKSEDCTILQTGDYGGGEEISRVVLKESYQEEDEKDVYKTIIKTQYREMVLVNIDGKQCVEVNIYRQDKKDKWQPLEPSYPEYKTGRLDFIPCVIINASSSEFKISEPPIMEVVRLSLSIFSNSADYENALHWLQTSMTYISANTQKDQASVEYKEGTVLILPQGASVGSVPFSDSNCELIAKHMETKREIISSISSKAIVNYISASTSPDVIKMQQSGDEAMLINISQRIDAGLTKIVRMMEKWNGIKDSKATVSLDKDFWSFKIAPENLRELRATWEAGGMSIETFLHNLRKGEVFPDGLTVEEEKALIQNAFLERITNDLEPRQGEEDDEE